MKLKHYLKHKKYTQESFVADLQQKTGVEIPQGTLSKYVLGSRIPNPINMRAIFDATNGAVSPNDFYI